MSAVSTDRAPGTAACLFEVAGRVLAIAITDAREVHAFDGYTTVPLAPSQLIGMTNLRGAIVPLVDLHVMLDLPPRPSARPIESLVVEAHGVRVALAIDRMLGIEPCDEALSTGDPGCATAGLERGGVRRGDDTVPILDVVKIVGSLTTWNQEVR